MIYKFRTKESGIGIDFDIELEKDSNVYCFIGKNGIGKTKLLEFMAKSLIFKHSIFLKNKKYRYSDIFKKKEIYEKLKKVYLQLPVEIEVNDIKIKDKIKHPWGFTKFEHISQFINTDEKIVCDKPIVFIGAQNRGYTKNINPQNIKILPDLENRFLESFGRTLSYLNKNGLKKEEIADWFVSRLIINPNFVIQKQNKTNEVITVLQLIEKLEPSLKLVHKYENGGYGLSILYNEGKLIFDGIPLDKLSTGFVSIIKIFQEIVAGYGGWSNLEDLNKVDGIVFIDEIEAHLHIGWQTKIIKILKEYFPNTTFYIATHSPVVLSGLKTSEAYELYIDNHIVNSRKIDNIENYFLNDIIKEFFGVDLNREKLDSANLEKQKKTKEKLLELLDIIQEDEQ